MAFRDILIHIDNTPYCAARLALAIDIAQQHQAHLTGLYVIMHPHYKPEHERTGRMAVEAEERFKRETAHAGIVAEWLSVDCSVTGVSMTEIVKLHAYHKDLVIVGQTDPSSREGDVPPDLPERLVAGSGRPVLVVPYVGTFAAVGKRVMVAWRAGRESVRALSDAMPFLLEAQQVNVLAVNPPSAQIGPGWSCCDDIAKHLARHGVDARVEQFVAADVHVGNVLLNRAWEEGCELLVMGAYTHTTRGSLALGLVAKYVLKHMTLPVLMSH